MHPCKEDSKGVKAKLLEIRDEGSGAQRLHAKRKGRDTNEARTKIQSLFFAFAVPFLKVTLKYGMHAGAVAVQMSDEPGGQAWQQSNGEGDGARQWRF